MPRPDISGSHPIRMSQPIACYSCCFDLHKDVWIPRNRRHHNLLEDYAGGDSMQMETGEIGNAEVAAIAPVQTLPSSARSGSFATDYCRSLDRFWV